MALGAVAVVAVLFGAPRGRLDDDSAVWATYQTCIRHGQAPYVDIPQGKGPAMFLYGYLIGSLPHEPYYVPAVQVAIVWMAAVLVGLAAGMTLGRWAGIAAAAMVLPTLSYWPVGLRTMAPNLLLYSVAVAAIAWAWRWEIAWPWAIAGAALMVAALGRQPAGAQWLAAIAAAWLASKRPRTAIVAYLVGSTIACAAICGWVVHLGTPVEVLVKSLLGRRTVQYAFNLPPRRYLANLLDTANYMEPFVPLAGFGIAGWAAAWLWGCGGRANRLWKPVLAALVVGVAIETLATMRFYAHYFLAFLPLLAIGAGILAEQARSHVRKNSLTAALVVGCIAAVLLAMPRPLHSAGSRWKRLLITRPAYSRPEYLVGKWLRANTAEGEWLFCFCDNPFVYYYADRLPLRCRPHGNRYPFYLSTFSEEQLSVWLEALKGRRPRYVVIDRTMEDVFPLRDFIQSRYKPVHSIGQYVIYERRPPTSAL